MFKNLLAFASFSLLGLASLVVSLDDTSFNVDSNPILIAPESAEVGELVRVHSGSDVVKWITIPEVVDIQEYGSGSIAISFRSPGHYIIVAATYNGSDLALEKKVISVRSPVVVPESEPLPSPSPVASDLSQLVTRWCAEAKVSEAVSKRLADNFRKVAESQTVEDVAFLLRETASLNSLIPAGSHQSVLAKIQAHLLKAPPTTLEQYKSVWQEVSAGFLAYKGV